MKPEKIFILANTTARTLDLPAIKAAAAIINRHVPTEILATTTMRHAIDSAAKLSSNPANLVVACGGDGTINTLLNAIQPQATLGIIPTGTANVIARELGVPLNITDAAKTLLTGAVQEIDMGTCNGQKFAFVAGIGFDAQVAAAVSAVLKRLIGRAAYYIAGLLEFITYKAPELKIIVDDNTAYHGHFALFANMRRYGGELFFAPQARYDDGILQMVLLKSFSVHAMLRLLNFARGNSGFPDDVAVAVSGKDFKVTCNTATPWQLDGEVFPAASKFNIGLSPDKTRIISL